MHDNVKYLIDRGWESTSRAGVELRGCCPFPQHEDSNPSFSINNSTGSFNCKGCNRGGNSLATLMMYCEGLTLEEVREKLGSKSNPAPRAADTNLKVQKYCHAVLTHEGKLGSIIPKIRTQVNSYLKRRNYDPIKIIEKYNLGYTYIKTPVKSGISVEELYEIGMIKEDGHFFTADRLMIPITYRMSTIGFSLRSLYPNETKYLNIYNKKLYPQSSWLAGLDECSGESIIVAEGIFDMIRLKEYGYKACASMGTSLNGERLSLLRNFNTIYLMLDSDKSGLDAMEKIFFLSRQVCKESVIKTCILPDGKDPDECSRSEITMAIEKAKPAFEWITGKYMEASTIDEQVAKLQKLKHKVSSHVYDAHELKLFESAIEDQIINVNQYNQSRFNSVETILQFLTTSDMYTPHPVIEYKKTSTRSELYLLNKVYEFDPLGRPVMVKTLGPEHARWTLIRG